MNTSTSVRKVVGRDEWLVERRKLLLAEKELSRQHDRLAAARRSLPWVRIEKPYVFEGPDGQETLADLFAGRSQLLVYHFMLGPTMKEGCASCSLVADHFDATLPHLAARDATLVVVSRAPYPRLEAFRNRLGWRFKWVSSHGSDFNFDFGVSFTDEQRAAGAMPYNYGTIGDEGPEKEGASVFYRDGDEVLHTYSAYARGVEALMGTYSYLDLLPKGRDEQALDWPMQWVRHHDRY